MLDYGPAPREGKPGADPGGGGGGLGNRTGGPGRSSSSSSKNGGVIAEPAKGVIPIIYGTRWVPGQIVYRTGTSTGTGFIFEVSAGSSKFMERGVWVIETEALVFCEAHPDIEIRGFIYRDAEISTKTNVEAGKTLPSGLNRLCAVGGSFSGPVPPGTYAGSAIFYPNGNAAGDFSGNINTVWKRAAVLELAGLITGRSDETDKSQPPMLFEVQGLARDTGDHANPADVMVDLFTRAGEAGADLDVSDYDTYCAAEGFSAARYVGDESDAFELMRSLAAETNAAFAPVGGKLKVVPLSESGTQTATSLTEADFHMGVTVERIPEHECFTVVPVRYLRADPTQGDTEDSATSDQVALDTEVDRRASAMTTEWVATKEHAYKLSYLLAHRSYLVRNVYSFTLSPRWSRLECGDYVSLTTASLGLDGVAARVTSIDDTAEGWIQVKAEEYLGVVSPTPPVWTPEGGGSNDSPTPPPADQGTLEADIAEIEARLADMALDSKLVMSERRNVYGLLDPLFREHNDLMQKAIGFTASRIDPDSYNDSISRLWAYCVATPPTSGAAASGLSGTTTFTNGLGITGAAGGWPEGNAGHTTGTPPTQANWTTWFSGGDANGTITIHAETFRDVVGDALMERQLLLNAMNGSLRSSVDAITETIGQVADDGYLAYNEKRSMYIIYRGYIDEQANLDSQAAVQNLADTAPGDVVYDYDAAVDALKAYWTAAIPTDNLPANVTTSTGLGLAAAVPSDAQVHTWMTAIPNIAIHPATFRSKHLAVVAARTDLVTALQADTHDRVVDAIARIDAFASDGKISVNEKPAVYREYQALCFESVSLNLQADESNIAAKVNTAHEAYKVSLWDLQTYLNGLGLPPAPGTSPTINQPSDSNLGTWLSATAAPNDAFHDCTIVRSTFVSKFGTVYSNRAALQRAISDAHAAALAELDRIRADGWLSAGEKRAVLDQYVAIVGEEGPLTTQANNQGVTTHLTNYTAAVDRLQAYFVAAMPGAGVPATSGHGLGFTMSNTSAPSEAETTAWMALTQSDAPAGSGDIKIHPATFRTRFADCYATSAQLVAELARDAWATADSAMARLANLASDGVITSGEKDPIFREYKELIEERVSYDYRASNAAFAAVTAVQTARANYDQATWRLQRYMYGTLGCPPDTVSGTDASPWTVSTPADGHRVTWKSSGNANGIAGDTVVVQSTLLSTFSAVYTTRTALENALGDASQAASAGAYTLALGRNRYGTRAQRLALSTAGLSVGDNFFESDYGYKCWVWDGAAWRDSLSSTATLGVETYYVGTLGERDALTGMGAGDLCYVTSTKAWYRYSGTAWVVTVTEPSVPTISSGTSAPSFPKVGDVWWDTTGGANIPKRYNGTIWEDLSQPTGVHTFGPQTNTPTALSVGDIWYDSNTTPPLTKRWNGTSWVTIAGNKVTSSNTAPSNPIVGDVWLDTTGGLNVFKVWSGSAWVAQGSGNTIWTQSTAPATPRTGDLWYDTSTTPNVLKVYGGSAWTALVGTGMLTAAMMATGTLSAGNITAGTLQAGVLYAGDLTAGQIKSGSIDAARVTAANLTSGSINATAMTVTGLNAGAITAGTLDAARVTAANLTAGTINGTSMTISNIAAGAIRAGSLQSDVIYTGTLNASQINAGTLDAARIGAGTITAKSLTVTGFENLWPNGNSEGARPAGYTPPNNGTDPEFDYIYDATAWGLAPPSGPNVRSLGLATTGGAATKELRGRAVGCAPGDGFYLEAMAAFASYASAAADSLDVFIEWLNPSMAVVGYATTTARLASQTPTTFLRVSATGAAPASVAFARPVLRVQTTGSTGNLNACFDSILFRGKISSSFISGDAIQTTDYNGTNRDTAAESCTAGARMRVNAGGTGPAIITSASGIRIGTKTLDQTWLASGRGFAYIVEWNGTTLSCSTAVGAPWSGYLSSSNVLSIPTGAANTAVVVTGHLDMTASGVRTIYLPFALSTWRTDASGIVSMTWGQVTNPASGTILNSAGTTWRANIQIMAQVSTF
jgi:hypothetical protein